MAFFTRNLTYKARLLKGEGSEFGAIRRKFLVLSFQLICSMPSALGSLRPFQVALETNCLRTKMTRTINFS